MKKRLLSGIILLAIFYLSMLSNVSCSLMLGLTQVLACTEWRRFLPPRTSSKGGLGASGKIENWSGIAVGLISLLLLSSFYQHRACLFQSALISFVASASSLGWIVVGWLLYLYPKPVKIPFFTHFIAKECLSIFMLVPLLWSILYLWLQYQATPLFALPFVLSFAMDVGAFFAGKKWGKRLLAPAISPQKTWEGALGGFILSSLLLLLWSRFLPTRSMAFYIGTFLFIPPAAVLGDLFESYLKRMSGLKDSGRLIPGHGGVLDRIDSLCATLPCFVCILIHT